MFKIINTGKAMLEIRQLEREVKGCILNEDTPKSDDAMVAYLRDSIAWLDEMETI